MNLLASRGLRAHREVPSPRGLVQPSRRHRRRRSNRRRAHARRHQDLIGDRMTKHLLLAFLVACSGGSKTATPATPPAPDPVPVNEPVAEPAKPPEPMEPAPPEPPPAPDPAQLRAELLAAETAAFEKAKPVFDKWCSKCHSKTGKNKSKKKLEHFDMTTYPFGGEHAMEIGDEIRETLGLAGKKPTMPADKKGAVKGEELELIKAWADTFDASHKGGAHEGHGQGHKQ
jgi:hypothetical protein